jgi:hypothetical protein
VAALAAIGFTGAAVAADAGKGWSTTTATAPTAMSDSDMDKVTAGAKEAGRKAPMRRMVTS